MVRITCPLASVLCDCSTCDMRLRCCCIQSTTSVCRAWGVPENILSCIKNLFAPIYAGLFSQPFNKVKNKAAPASWRRGLSSPHERTSNRKAAACAGLPRSYFMAAPVIYCHAPQIHLGHTTDGALCGLGTRHPVYFVLPAPVAGQGHFAVVVW